MTVIPAPPREELPVLGTWGTQEGTRLEPLDRWIHRARTEVWMREPKPAEITLALGLNVRRELLMEVDHRHLEPLLGDRPKFFGMDIVVDPTLDTFEIRYTTWAEQQLRRHQP